MKKLYFLLFTLLISAISFGQVILAEDFSYSDGSLVSQSAWVNNGGTAGDFLVSSGQAVVQHGTPSEDVEIEFTAVSGNIYAAFDFSVDDLGAPYSGSDNEYFAHLDFSTRVDIVPPTGGGDFTVGISTTSGSADATWATDLTFGQAYRVVVKYDQDGGVAQLWIDPALETDTSISGNVDTTPATITSFDLRQSDSSENETLRVDNLMIGQTFNDVLVFTAQTDPTLIITSPANGTVLDPGTTSVDISIDVQNFIVGNPGAGIDGHIHWSIDEGSGAVTQPMKYDTNDESITVTDGGTYTVYMELVDNSHNPISPAVNTTVTFSVASITQVPDIATFRAGTSGDYYEIAGEVVVSFVTGNSRNQIFIQDASGGILIDDNNGIITTTYNNGDGITGLKGQLGEFASVMQLVPSEDPGMTSSTSNTITPQVVTINDLTSSIDTYESELVQINDVTFADGDGTATFGSTGSSNYDISDASGSMVFRTNYPNDNMDGEVIPSSPTSIIVLAGQYNSTIQVYPRQPNEVLSINHFETVNFSMYPNPTNVGYVTITSNNSDDINTQVYDVLGKQVINTTITPNKNLDVSGLNSGVYIVRLTQNNNTITKKLVIR